MPVNIKDYPASWPAFRITILARSLLRCECTGQCDQHQPHPMPRRCCELQGKPARYFRGPVRLTIAHTCTCVPLCANPAHVLALCQKCHLRLDRFKHAAARLATQKRKGLQIDFRPSTITQ